jgi:hypothetical protein
MGKPCVAIVRAGSALRAHAWAAYREALPGRKVGQRGAGGRALDVTRTRYRLGTGGGALVHHITVRQSTACVHAQIHWCAQHGLGQPKRTFAQQNASLQTSLGHGRAAIVAFGTSPPAHDHWLLMHVGLTGGHAFHSEPSASRR